MSEPGYYDGEPVDADEIGDIRDHGESNARKRALVGLIALAVVTGLFVGLMVLFVGGSGGKGGTHLGGAAATQPAENTPTAPTTHAASQPPSAPASHPATAHATKPATRPPTRPATHPPTVNPAHPCPSAAACALPGDGGLIAALNALRAQHGLPPVPGSPTGQAQQCALSQGSGPACAPHYAWQPVEAIDAGKVLSKVSAEWLLDPHMGTVSVGWAYTPGPNGTGGQYACAILKTG